MLISLFKYDQRKTEIPTSIYKMGGPSVDLCLWSFLLFIIPFNFGYVHIINSNLKKCENISDNLTKTFRIHEMYGCQCMILKGINIVLVSVIICSIVDSLINTSTLRERRQVLLIQKWFLWKETSSY